MCQHLEQLTRTIEMTVSPMLQTATASKVGCCCIAAELVTKHLQVGSCHCCEQCGSQGLMA